MLESVPSDEPTRGMLTTLVCSLEAERKQQKAKLDTSGWRLSGTDAQSVSAQMRQLLKQSGAQVRPHAPRA